jgi:hypothetical protein
MQCEKELVRSFLGEWILIVLLRPKGDFYLGGGSIWRTKNGKEEGK